MSGRSSATRLDWATRHPPRRQECSGSTSTHGRTNAPPLLSFVRSPTTAPAPGCFSARRRRRHTHPWRKDHCSFLNLDRTEMHRSSKAATASSSSSTELRMALPTAAADGLTVGDAVMVQQQQFEPVLNVPAFSVFLLVALLFAGLQWRVAAIGRAAEERTMALERLRRAKARQLSQGGGGGGGGGVGAGDDEAQVRQAAEAYERAYWKVETLRTVIPGVARLVPPPSQSLNRQITEENEAAAQQFLGIEAEEEEPVSEEKQLSPVLTAVLAVIAISQIALLVLFVATDPMLMGSGGNGGGSLLDGVVDAVSGME